MNRIMTVRAPDDLQLALSEAAQRIGIGRNALILQILWDWIKTHAG